MLGFTHWPPSENSVAGQLIPLHRPTRQARDLNQLLREQPELEELIIDGTERRLPQPQHRGKQKRFYSGRKKRHAVKNVLIVGQRRVLWCSPTVPAKCHDKKVAERARLRLPDKIHLLGDSGFEGLEAGGADVVTPWTRRNRPNLHWRHRRFNRLLATNRIPVEHTLALTSLLLILSNKNPTTEVRMPITTSAICQPSVFISTPYFGHPPAAPSTTRQTPRTIIASGVFSISVTTAGFLSSSSGMK